MIPIELEDIFNDECYFDIYEDEMNTFDYDLWETRRDVKNYNISYKNGTIKKLYEADGINLIDINNVIGNDISYRFSDKIYNFDDNIGMMKLYMALYLTRNYINFNDKGEYIIFKFYLYDNEDKYYDIEIELKINKKILVDKHKKPLINSNYLLDHLILKAFIKLSKTMNIDINDINVNSLVGICRRGKLYKMNINENVKFSNMDHTIDDLLNDSNKDIYQKAKQCAWISDNIINIINGNDFIPYNECDKTIYKLFKNENLMGITIKNSFLYLIEDMKVNEYGRLKVCFRNIFQENTIDMNFDTFIDGIDKIGILLK
jgi:hypothetical protein